MNRRTLIAILAALPLSALAQNAFDAYQLSRNDLRGTARFMSMGGAFGALGGDLSTLNQNPGGIGIYRKSEVGFTLDIDMQSTQTSSTLDKVKDTQTKVGVNNIGYVGTSSTGSSVMPYFNWGFSYGRVNSFNRRYRGTTDMNGSLSNYIADFTNGIGSSYLSSNEENYWAYDHAPWLSILAYNSYMINPTAATPDQYNGLWGNGTYGVSDFQVEERGYVDEYEINLGGNLMNTVYWGVGVGIDDIDYQRFVYYEEYLNNAQIPVVDAQGNVVAGQPTPTTGDVGFGLDSYKHISGTGFNFKAGVIVKPINELRLGLAVHTPTYYNLTESSDAVVDYGYGYTTDPLKPGATGSPASVLNWKLRTPWRLMASAAAVIGSNAIVSVDYEYRPYQNMTTKTDGGDNLIDVNNDIKSYYKAANILRIGAEYRVSNNFSVRAGYAFESTPTGADLADSRTVMYTSNMDNSDTMPSYTTDNTTQYITCGIGYRYKAFYADAAYVHKSYKSEYHPYTANDYTATPLSAEVKSSNNNLVLSVGFKF